MIGYLHEVTTRDGASDGFSFEIYSTPNTAISWSGWWDTIDEALTVPQMTVVSRDSHERRIEQFNKLDRRDGLKLTLHSTYTPDTHPELFI